MQGIDQGAIRKDFPILDTQMNGKPLIYLDSAATSQKPVQVIEAISDYYRRYNANIHRGIYKIAEDATQAYTDSKEKLARFIGAKSYREIVYTRNTTEAINVAALCWGAENIGKGDHILISQMEHHSNILPWRVLATKKGAIVDYAELDGNRSELDMERLKDHLADKPKIVAITHASNVLGTINNVREICRMAHEVGAAVLVDGAQSAPHMKVDVRDIDCEFFALSGHKMLGPTGIGTLYAKEDILEGIEPLFTGGDMINAVSYSDYSWNTLPWKFEAGTSNIAGGIGLGAAVDYLSKVGMDTIRNHEKELTSYALDRLAGIDGINVFGLGADAVERRGGVISFSVEGIHPHDVAQVFDSEGIAIRAGHHCAMPLVKETLGESALSRMSFYIYNSKSDIDAAVEAIDKLKKLFKR